MSETNQEPEDMKTEEPLDPQMASEVFDKLLAGEDVVQSIETHRGIFSIKYPLGRDFIEIDRRKAFMRGGAPLASFDANAEGNMEAYATLDVVVVEAPKWWKDMKSAADCPDPTLIDDLYRGYLRHVGKVRAVLSVGEPGTGNGGSKPKDKDAPVARGLFSGLSFRPKSPKPQR